MNEEENWVIINTGWNEGIALPFSDFATMADRLIHVGVDNDAITVKDALKFTLVRGEVINAARVRARITQ
jgi:hypothetical protein